MYVCSCMYDYHMCVYVCMIIICVCIYDIISFSICKGAHLPFSTLVCVCFCESACVCLVVSVCTCVVYAGVFLRVRLSFYFTPL